MTGSPTLRLLLACAPWRVTVETRARVHSAAMAAEVDWLRWLALVRAHRLVPHALRHLVADGTAAPEWIHGALREDANAIALRAVLRTRQLVQVVAGFSEMGVPVLPFKGPVFSLAAYGDAGVRDSVDLDIVVLPGDVNRAREALVRLGYRPRHGMSPAQERAIQTSFGHFEYERPGEPAPLELHWRFAQPRYPWSLVPTDVLARSTECALGGVMVRVPELHDHVLLQCMHGARHQWDELEWLSALGALLRSGPVDGALLLERAEAHGSRRALLLGMRLLHDLLGDEVPVGVASAAHAQPAVVQAAAEIGSAIESRLGRDNTAEPYRQNLRLMERMLDRVHYVARSVFQPTIREWELVRLPDALLPLYYPIRLGRLGARALRHLFAAPAKERGEM